MYPSVGYFVDLYHVWITIKIDSETKNYGENLKKVEAAICSFDFQQINLIKTCY